MKGSIDDVRIYNRALSATEIQSLYYLGDADKINSSTSQSQGTGRLDSGLQSYWSLDENTGTTTTDASTNGATGTLTNGPVWTTGQISSGVDFDGTDDYITAPDADALDVVDARNFVLSGWFNRDTFTTDDTIVAKSNGQTAADTGYNAYIDDATDKLTFVANDATDQYKLESVSTFTATGWHHFAIAWNDSLSTETKLYIDGVAESATATGTFANVNSLANALAFRLGAESDNGNPFDGKIDEVRLYNRTLTADEVAQAYRLTTPTSVDISLKGYWSFNGQDLSGTTAYDRSGSGNNGTLTSGPTAAIGQAGQAIDFDGSDDYVSTADAASLDFGDTADLALTGWFYRDTATTDDIIVAKRNGIVAGDTGYIAYIDDATDKFTFEVSDGVDEYQIESASTFAATGWNHFTLVWDENSAPGTTLYINGAYETTVATGTIGNIGDLSNTLTLKIGAESDNGNPFDGRLDEIRVYNKVLTAAEVWGRYLAEGTDKKTCGTVTDADGNIYGTVVIGSQCWMRQSMRVGTRIAAATSQTNNGTIEKYCYSDSDANCTAANPNQPDGGLYQWNEAMQYSTTAGARGICPSGWHIPTDTEQYTLENYLKDAGQTCNASRTGYGCSSAGTKLKPGGASRFEGNLAGDSVSSRGTYGNWWSSSESGALAWVRYLRSSLATVNRSADDKTIGFSVRCVQD